MVEFTLNFVGVTAADFQRAYAFYTETLGVHPALTHSDEPASWAMLVDGWDDTPVPDARGFRCELFERDVDPPAERWWGHNQNVRPVIHVTDLQTVTADLRNRGVTFTEESEDTSEGRSIEFTAPEDVRWSLAEASGYPAGQGVQTPHIGRVELKTADIDRQLEFYTELMDLRIAERSPARIRLEQGSSEPHLLLEAGGERVTTDDEYDSPFDIQPVWLSFETPDITDAAEWLTAQNVPLLQDVTTHEWGGTDITIEDPDGNPLQVVEYHET